MDTIVIIQYLLIIVKRISKIIYKLLINNIKFHNLNGFKISYGIKQMSIEVKYHRNYFNIRNLLKKNTLKTLNYSFIIFYFFSIK